MSEEESGYLRTNANGGLVRLKSNWIYDIKIVAKFVMDDSATKAGEKRIERLRVQVLGHLYKLKKGAIVESYNGYDKIVLQDLFNDLELVFGRQQERPQPDYHQRPNLACPPKTGPPEMGQSRVNSEPKRTSDEAKPVHG